MDQEIRTLEVGAELRSLDNNEEAKPTTPDTGAEQQSDDKEAKPDVDDGKLHISGYALKFDTPSKDLGGFVEILDKDSLSDIELDGIKLLNNHDFSQVLASSPETMTLTVDGTGLKFEADLDPEVSFAKDVYQNVKNGNLDKCSFGFATDQDEFIKEGEQVVRHIKKINSLFDVSIVAIPAYDDTSVSTRSYTEFIKQNEKVEEDNMTTKILKDGKSNMDMEERSFIEYIQTHGEKRDGITSFEGAPLVPSSVISPIFRPASNSLDLSKFVNVKNVKTQSGTYPIAINNGAVLSDHAENGSIEQVDAGVKAIDFKVTTKAGKIFVSNEVIADSTGSTLLNEIKQQLSVLVQNTNNKHIADLLQKSDKTEVADLDSLKRTIDTKLDPTLTNKIVLMNQSSFAEVDCMKDSTGRYLLQMSIADPTQKTLFGMPVVIVPDSLMPVTDGQLDYYVGSLFDYCAEFLREQVTVQWTAFDMLASGLSVAVRNSFEEVDHSAMQHIILKPASAPAGK